MTTIDSKDLPPIVHYMQVIILGCIVEARHRAQFQQHMQPDSARVQAMSINVNPVGRQDQEMVAESFRVAVRLWKAFKVLDIRCTNEGRTVPAEDIIMAGL
jgi:hypothetical protein